MLKKYHKLQPKSNMTDELKVALQIVWEELPPEHVNNAVGNFTKGLTAYVVVAANGGHSKHLQYLCPSPSLHLYLVTSKAAFQSHQQTTGEDSTQNADKWGSCLG